MKPDPIFFQSLRKNTGARRTAVFVLNEDDVEYEGKVETIQQPDWLCLEEIIDTTGRSVRITDGQDLFFKPNQRKRFIANVNTDHRFLPEGSSTDEQVDVPLAGGRRIPVILFYIVPPVLLVLLVVLVIIIGVASRRKKLKKRIAELEAVHAREAVRDK